MRQHWIAINCRIAPAAFVAVIASLWLSGCASHSQSLEEVRHALLRGNPTEALTEFSDKKEKPDDLLYLLERGLLEHEAGNYAASNRALDAAELLAEELYTKSVTKELAALITSDNVIPYRGYPHELVMIQYYRAFNYLGLGQHDEALVEARKANQRLATLADEKEGKATYRNDAFMQYFTGLLYEDAGEWNDAAVSYRNAYGAYQLYEEMYGTSMPETLPADLYHALTRIGADDEALRLSEEHSGIADASLEQRDANVIVFVEYGFSSYLEPVDIVLPIFDTKDDDEYRDCDGCERDYAGVLVGRYGSNIYSYSGSRYTLDHVLSFSFPQVVDYPSRAAWARINAPLSRVVPAVPAEPLGSIMKHSFNERIPGILLKTVVRALVKEFARVQVKKQDKTLGALINILNVATEQSDTRSWLFLPKSIGMVTLVLPPGQQDLEIVFHASDDTVIEKQTVPINVDAHGTTFVRVRCYQ